MFVSHSLKRSFSCITLRSKLFIPTKKDASLGKVDMPKYARLLLKGGYLHQTETGMYSFLPIGQMLIKQIAGLIDMKLEEVGANQIQMPILQNMSRWEQSGRREQMEAELYKLKDRKGHEMCLSPTNEEVITSIVKDLAIPSSYPILLYQTSSKFRDEKRVKGGLLRSKEFLMMDAYSFDATEVEASNSFEKMKTCFLSVFKALDIPIEVVRASNGAMGGSQSLEFQCVCGIGEDVLFKCSKCHAISTSNKDDIAACSCCGEQDGEQVTSIELGHIFLLGDHYSKSFALKNKTNIMMGCYGLGISRIFGCISHLYGYSGGFLFPDYLTTYDIAVVNTNPDSSKCKECTTELLGALSDTTALKVLYDDRTSLSLGTRLSDAELAGIRVAIIIGKQFEAKEEIEIRLLHKNVISSVLRGEIDSSDVSPSLVEKIKQFDYSRLNQLGYHCDMAEKDGFSVYSSFSSLYWNIVQTLSCVKVYPAKTSL